jgi:hypothetical protein
MPELLSYKGLAAILGGLTLFGVFVWQTIRFWKSYAKVGGTGNLLGGVAFVLFILVWIVVAVRMVF